MKWRGLALWGVLFVSGCAWKAYDPKLHALTPTPTPTVAVHDPERPRKLRLFQAACAQRAVAMHGVQLLDQDPRAAVFRLRDGSQVSVDFEKLYESDPRAPLSAIDEYLARELASNPPALPLDGVEPRLRTAIQVQPWRYQLEQDKIPPEEWPVWEPIVGDLLVAYVVEPPGSGRRWVVTGGQLARGGMTRALARTVAVANLERRLGPDQISRTELPDSPLLQVIQEQAAVRLLNPALLGRLAKEAGGDLLLAVPHTRCLMAISARSEQARQWLLTEAQSRSLEPDGLSSQIFRFSPATGQLKGQE